MSASFHREISFVYRLNRTTNMLSHASASYVTGELVPCTVQTTIHIPEKTNRKTTKQNHWHAIDRRRNQICERH